MRTADQDGARTVLQDYHGICDDHPQVVTVITHLDFLAGNMPSLVTRQLIV